MGSTRFRNPQALSSALASLGTLQPRAFGFLNRVDPLVSASNLYLAEDFGRVKSDTGYTDFVEAVTGANQEACSGPPDGQPSGDNVTDLIQRFVTTPLSKVQELRRIFGEMLCITNSDDSSTRRKREGPDPCAGVVCPVGGFDKVFIACGFFCPPG